MPYRRGALMTFEILTDSSCNLPEELIDELNLHILPLTFMNEGTTYQSYLKGQHIDLKQFYTMMREGAVFTTSLPTYSVAKETMEAILSSGKDLLYLGFSSGLSSTFETMSSIAYELQQSYPSQKVICVDTLAASVGQGLLVYLAAKKAQEGASIDEVCQWTEDNKLNLCHWFTVDDLQYLYRGGRVSKTAAFAGTLLNIKPVLHVDNNGHLIPMEKTRGRKKSIQSLVAHMKDTALAPVEEQVVGISHGDCLEDALALKKLVEDAFGVKKFIINIIDPVIGAHSGPGTLALFYLGSQR